MMEKLEEELHQRNKTPVSWLFELCTKQGCPPPKFEEKDVGTALMPLFEITARVRGWESVEVSFAAKCSKKKTAKQKAAVGVISLLKITIEDLTDMSNNNCNKKSSQESSAVSSTVEQQELVPTAGVSDKVITINESVSSKRCDELQSLCQKRDFGFPEYQDVGFEGPSNRPTFTAVCKVNDKRGEEFLAEGKACKKKLAKYAAAEKMLNILRLVPLATEKMEEVFGLCTDLQLFEVPKAIPTYGCEFNRAKCHRLFSHQHHKFQFFGSTMGKIRQNCDTVSSEFTLDQIAKEEHFQVAFRDTQFAASGNHQCFCEFIFPRRSVLQGIPSTFLGEGDTVQNAREKAASEALLFLKTVG